MSIENSQAFSAAVQSLFKVRDRDFSEMCQLIDEYSKQFPVEDADDERQRNLLILSLAVIKLYTLLGRVDEGVIKEIAKHASPSSP